MSEHQNINYQFKDIFTGSDLSNRRIALMEAQTKEPEPVVWLTAGLHGNEVGGIAVIHEIFKRLETHPLKKGSIKAFPLLNPIGFETGTRHIPVSEEDLNRSFPGNPSGTFAERLAHVVFKTIADTKPAIVLDLHNDWIKSIPYLLVDPKPEERKGERAFEIAEKIAKDSELLAVREREEDMPAIKKTLSGSLIHAGIPALTLELGEPFTVNEKNVADGVAAVWNILLEIDMLHSSSPAHTNFIPPAEIKNKILYYYDRPISDISGLVRFSITPGQIVKRGDEIAKVSDVFGKIKETIAAEVDGVVLGYTDKTFIFPGAHFATFGAFGFN